MLPWCTPRCTPWKDTSRTASRQNSAAPSSSCLGRVAIGEIRGIAEFEMPPRPPDRASHRRALGRAEAFEPPVPVGLAAHDLASPAIQAAGVGVAVAIGDRPQPAARGTAHDRHFVGLKPCPSPPRLTPPRVRYLLVGRSCPIWISFVSRSRSAVDASQLPSTPRTPLAPAEHGSSCRQDQAFSQTIPSCRN